MSTTPQRLPKVESIGIISYKFFITFFNYPTNPQPSFIRSKFNRYLDTIFVTRLRHSICFTTLVINLIIPLFFLKCSSLERLIISKENLFKLLVNLVTHLQYNKKLYLFISKCVYKSSVIAFISTVIAFISRAVVFI